MNNTELQILALLIATSLGVLFIAVFSKRKDPNEPAEVIEVPASPAAIDHKKIIDSIAKSTTIEEIRKLQEASDRFFDLHWGKINSEVLQAYYAYTLEAISKKLKEINGQPVTVL